MEPFTLHNPVTLHFGKDCIEDLPKTLSEYGTRILLMYGRSSIKSSGLYDRIHHLLQSFECVEYEGIKSNPVYEDVDKAAAIGREKKVDMILAIGGGSVIDSAKMTSISIPVTHSVWDFYTKKEVPKHSVPLINVLTLAATGTEMNPYAVLQNNETGEKRGFGSPFTYAKHSFLDPQLTTTVSKEYTIYGIVDLVAHCLEQYFGEGESSLSDRFVFSVIQEAIAYAPKLIENLTDYHLREQMMWSATVALNGWLNVGRKSGDWGVHGLEHTLSVLYDIPHGAGLSICYPAWLKFMANQIPERIMHLGKGVFGVSTVEETIVRFESFFASIGSPVYLDEIHISRTEKDAIYQNLCSSSVSGMHYPLSENDYHSLIDLMFITT